MKYLLIIFLLPLFVTAQTFKGLTIKNESKAVVSVKDNLTISAVPYYSVLWFSQDSTTKPDSMIITARPLGKSKFAAQLRLSSIEGKLQGKVVPVQFDSIGWQRIAIDAKLFAVDSVKTTRFYITSGDKDGFEFSDISFKKKYVAPPVIVVPVPEIQPIKAETAKAKEYWFFRSLDPRLILTVKKGNGTDTLDLKLKD